MSDSTPTAPPLSRNPVVTAIVGFCAGLVLAYGIGLWQRSVALSAQAEAHAAALASKDAEQSALASQLAEARRSAVISASRAALVQVRLTIFQAINDLDQRNFGVASDRLRDAATLFDGVDAAALGLDPTLLATLKAEIAGTQVLVATDFEQQRLALLELAARIEAQTASTGAP